MFNLGRSNMYLSQLFDIWQEGVVDPLRSSRDVLRRLCVVDDPSSDLVDALVLIEGAIKRLEIGTEEIHTLEGAGVGEFREPGRGSMEDFARWQAQRLIAEGS
jgi:hypothetical protein